MNNPKIAAPQTAKPKRPWWVWLLLSLGAILVLLVVLVVAGFFVARSVVNNYTSPQAKPLPKLDYDPAAQKQFQQELAERWTTFSKAALRRQHPAPFRISVDEINRFLAQQRDFREHARLVVRNNRLQADFTMPLAKAGIKELASRHLNGTANIDFTFQDGWLTVSVGKVEVNGHPAPDWVVKRVAGGNFARQLDGNHEFVELMQEIETVEIKDGEIILTPRKQ